jgi:hypothetical protein
MRRTRDIAEVNAFFAETRSTPLTLDASSS